MSRFSERISTISSGVVESMKEFPVETLYGLTFFVLSIISDVADTGLFERGKAPVDPHILLVFIPLFVLSFFLDRVRVNRGDRGMKWLYYLSYFLWIPFLFLDMSSMTDTPGFWFTYLLAAILLTLQGFRSDNESFGRNMLNVFLQIVFAFFVGGILVLVVEAIVASADFLFALKLSNLWYSYPALFTALTVIPLLSCWFVTHNSDNITRHRVFAVIIDYILSPALVIYAVLLYIYVFKIVINWELPAGGVAYLVTAFIAVSLLCILLRHTIEKRHFDWFFRNFTWIAILPLALLWVGTVYRTGQYGLTQWRFYLFVLDVLMTLFIFMLLGDNVRRFRQMTVIFAVALIAFTYIPWISAKSIGIRSQSARLDKMLPLKQDHEAYGAMSYLKEEMDSTAFAQKYGKYGQWMQDVDSLDTANGCNTVCLDRTVDLGEYDQLVPENSYTEENDSTTFYIKSQSGKVMLEYDIIDSLKADPTLLQRPSELLVHQNDSLRVVIQSFTQYSGNESDGSREFSWGTFSLFRRGRQSDGSGAGWTARRD